MLGDPVLVLGATGGQGRAVVEALRAREVPPGPWSAMTTPFEAGPDAEIAQGRAIIDAARHARVPHLVFSSVAGATAHTGVPHFDSKAAIWARTAFGPQDCSQESRHARTGTRGEAGRSVARLARR